MMLEVHSPFDLSTIASLEFTSNDSIEGLFQNAQHASQNPLSKHERIQILEKVIDSASSIREEISMLIANEGGKPLTDAVIEVDRGIQGIRNAIETLNAQAGEEIPMGLTPSSENRLAFTTREPIGTVVAISAFNHPFNLVVHQVIPAVATGCPVIIKPALTTPLSCVKLVGLLHEAGLPKEWCQLAILDNEGSEQLVTDERVRFFSFIGSAKVGWYLRSKLAPGTRCALEHGGAAPAIIDSNVDIDSIVAPLVKGAFYHAGQVCVSVQRIFVSNDIKDAFAEAFTAAVKKLKTGDARLPDTEVGPLILPREVDRVEEWVDEALADGAQALCGGKRISDTCFDPTVLLEPSKDSRVSSLEIFGPVACIYGYDKIDDAIERANSLPVAFQASVFTKDIDQAFYAAKRLNASAVMINDHTAFRVDWMPFAGRRTSGMGVGGIPRTMHEMTQEKLLVFKSPSL